MSTRPTTRRKVLTGLALTTGAALTRTLPALQLSDAAPAAQKPADPMRPQYHLQPARGWMNDPCGPIYWGGRYHMFFQYNPHAAVWGDMHWAHAVSPDMIRWRRQPIALAPTPGGPDQDGCFTGTAVVADGNPHPALHRRAQGADRQATLRDGNSNLRETQCLAVAEDDALLHWRKLPQPVIAAPPAGMDITGFRDPSPWREEKEGPWYMVVASGRRGVGGNVLLYKSSDLQPMAIPASVAQGKRSGKAGANPVDTGEMWECPDFFALEANTSSSTPPKARPCGRSAPSTATLCSSTQNGRPARSRRLLRPQDPARRAWQPHPLGLDSGVSPPGRVQRRRLGRHDVAPAPPLHRKWFADDGPRTRNRLTPNQGPHRSSGQASAYARAGDPPRP